MHKPAADLLFASALSGDQLATKIHSSWPWFIARASGIVAAILLLLLILSGIGQITGYAYKFLDPLPAWATHRALGISFAASVLVHVTALLFDTFVKFNIVQVLVPFVSSYGPFDIFGFHIRSLGVSLGILATYLLIAVMLSSLFWLDKKPSWWRLFHYLSYLIVILVFFHAMIVGTDIHNIVLKIIWIVGGLVVLGSITVRLWRAGTITKGKP